jgi:phosphopantothenoylcysteine decarboxylase/phosphopantothenate--cysteine ligase
VDGVKCIVTAGPTYEELDEVRRMTNFSTGALGTELANYLAGKGHAVTLLRGHYATTTIEPETRDVQIFTTTADLNERLESLASNETGAVFHAAAVSDFAFGKIWRTAASGKLARVAGRKISTHHGALLVELIPTPKIIAQLRQWFPEAILVGWKYEVDGTRAQAVKTAGRQLKENMTDACVANGPAYGKGFGVVEGPSRHRHLPDKKALFKALGNFLG